MTDPLEIIESFIPSAIPLDQSTATLPTEAELSRLWPPDLRKLWAPPERILPSEWAERYRYLARSQTDRPGPWSNDNAPYLADLMNLCSRPGIIRVDIRKPNQVGGSEALRNLVGYWAHRDPDPMGITLPDKTKGRTIIQERIIPLFRTTPVLRELLSSHSHDTKREQIKLRNGLLLHLMYTGEGTAMDTHPMRRVINDEVEDFQDPTAVGRTEKRLVTFEGKQLQVNISTPSYRGVGISALIEEDNVVLRYVVPCPHCKRYQTMDFGSLKSDWIRDKTRGESKHRAAMVRSTGEVWFECKFCGARIDEHHKAAMSRAGRYDSVDDDENPDGRIQDAGAREVWPAGSRVGLILDPFYCLWISWASIASEFILAESNYHRTFIFMTRTLGRQFEQVLERTRSSVFSKKCERASLPEGIVPKWAAALIATVDTQIDYFWVVVRAWGPEMMSQRVWHGRLESWEELHRFLFEKTWAVEGNAFPPPVISLVLIDSGGTRHEPGQSSRTMEVYRWALRRRARVRVIKGDNSPQVGLVYRPGTGFLSESGVKESRRRRRKEGRPLRIYLINTHHCNDELTDMVLAGTAPAKEGEEPEAEKWFLNQRDDPEYNSHLANMQKVPIRKNKKVTEEYRPVQPGARVDLRHCEVYQIAAAYMARVHTLPPMEEYLNSRKSETPSRPKRERGKPDSSTEGGHDPWAIRPLDL